MNESHNPKCSPMCKQGIDLPLMVMAPTVRVFKRFCDLNGLRADGFGHADPDAIFIRASEQLRGRSRIGFVIVQPDMLFMDSDLEILEQAAYLRGQGRLTDVSEYFMDVDLT